MPTAADKSGPAAWTTPNDVIAKLRRRFDRGEYLTDYANGAGFAPIGIPLRGPSAGELGELFDTARDWVAAWETVRPAGLRLEYREIGGRVIGANRLPARAWVDGYEQLWAVLSAGSAVRRFDRLLDAAAAVPGVRKWAAAHPHRALAVADRWSALLDTVTWIAGNQRPGLQVRQVDVPGVDTKFIETHRSVLTDLLEAVLEPGRIDSTAARSDFVRRFRFEPKPDYIRARVLDPDAGLVGPFREAWLRVDELAGHALPARHVLVVENETTYLALPPLADTVALWGGGYAVGRLAPVIWLADRDLIYWGDIDTHGFAILNRLRTAFPATRSVLMDEATLLHHRSQWVQEKEPTDAGQPSLTDEESRLYRWLVTGDLGPAVRLEQERIGFAWIEEALNQAVSSIA